VLTLLIPQYLKKIGYFGSLKFQELMRLVFFRIYKYLGF